jgi:hypothetical protein
MSFTVSIPKTGFAPGEMVDLKAHVNNPTSTGKSLTQFYEELSLAIIISPRNLSVGSVQQKIC